MTPIWGQAEVPPTVKGIIIFAITCAVSPFVPPPSVEPTGIVSWIIPISMEVGVGLFLGFVGRIILIVLDVVGNIISFQMGLSFSTVMNPSIQAQTTLPSHLLMQCGVVMMLSANMHHIFLRGLLDSYHMPLSLPDSGQHLVNTMQLFFSSALRLSMPFLMLHTFLQVTMGLLNRFVPSLSFFAFSIQVQLWAGLVVMLATITALLNEFPELIRVMWPH